MHRALVVVALLVLAACHDVAYPTSPEINKPATPTAVVAIFLSPSHTALPSGGGTSTIDVFTAAHDTGAAAAPNTAVTLSASTGALSTSQVTTDSTGHAKVEWSGAQTGEITATAGSIVGRTSIAVAAPVTTPQPNPGPSPGPGPAPTPTPSPGPAPTPTPAPTPGPAGDLALAIQTSPATLIAGQPVQFALALTSTTGAPVPWITRRAWDLNDDRVPDHVNETTPSATYAAGTHTVQAFVATEDGREVFATRTITVHGAPSVSLTANTQTTPINNQPIVFTAAPSVPPDVSVLGYEWSWGDGQTQITNPQTNVVGHTYSTTGTKTVTVKLLLSTGGTAPSASLPVVITLN